MSNLGLYQWFTSTGKKVGGAGNLIALIAAGGAVVGVTAYKGGEIVVKKIKASIKRNKENKKQPIESRERIYKILMYGESNEGLKFYVGNEFRILETDGNAVLIEKIGDQNNPYFVDKNLLNEISDYK